MGANAVDPTVGAPTPKLDASERASAGAQANAATRPWSMTCAWHERICSITQNPTVLMIWPPAPTGCLGLQKHAFAGQIAQSLAAHSALHRFRVVTNPEILA